MLPDAEIKKWFANHLARRRTLLLPTDPPIDPPNPAGHILDWREPTSGICAIRYICMGATLYVSGDLGSAVYQWNEAVTLEWITRCDIGYFAKKCEASEEGRKFVEWDQDTAVAKMAQFWIDNYPDDAEKRAREFDELNGPEALESRGAWVAWLAEYGPTAESPLGEDFYEYADVGCVTALRCRAHLIGLKMAMEKLGT